MLKFKYVNLTDRCPIVFVLFIIYTYQHVQSESTSETNQSDPENKQSEGLENLNEKRDEKKLSNVYSSSKANEFLSYDTCMQRMKCPVNRKEDCSEECTAGNTEEEIEEHNELTIGEHRSAMSKAPKLKYESNTNTKKKSNKNKNLSEQNQTTIKTDL